MDVGAGEKDQQLRAFATLANFLRAMFSGW